MPRLTPIQTLNASTFDTDDFFCGRAVDEPRAAVFAEIAIQEGAGRCWSPVVTKDVNLLLPLTRK